MAVITVTNYVLNIIHKHVLHYPVKLMDTTSGPPIPDLLTRVTKVDSSHKG